MIDEAEARAMVLEKIQRLPSKNVSLAEALDRFSAQPYLATIPLPAFDNSAMDGYAVAAADRAKGSRLQVSGEQPAGVDRKLRINAGETVRIFTGAPIPQGANAIVMQEDVTRDGDQVVLNAKVEEGEFIRRRGCDLSEGQGIVAQGQRITPALAALLASQGLAKLEVGGVPTAAVISTGDEIVSAGGNLRAGEIYDSNSVLLGALLQKLGVRVASASQCSDDPHALAAPIRKGADHSVLILTGGVSVGEHDLVQSILRSLGGTIDVWRVALKPGKPFLFGQLRDCAVFGLPGNPVSAFVTFLKFVRPALLKMMGANEGELELRRVRAELSEDLRNDGNRAHYIRGRYAEGVFSPIGRQESQALFGLSRANAIARLPSGAKFAAGSMLEVELYD